MKEMSSGGVAGASAGAATGGASGWSLLSNTTDMSLAVDVVDVSAKEVRPEAPLMAPPEAPPVTVAPPAGPLANMALCETVFLAELEFVSFLVFVEVDSFFPLV